MYYHNQRIVKMWPGSLFAQAGLELLSPDFYLLSNWDYSCEPLCLASGNLFKCPPTPLPSPQWARNLKA
jgi:hypothetical protein